MCTSCQRHNHLQGKAQVDTRGRRRCHRTRLGTPWDDIRLHGIVNTRRRRRRRHKSTYCREDILVVAEAEMVYAHPLP